MHTTALSVRCCRCPSPRSARSTPNRRRLFLDRGHLTACRLFPQFKGRPLFRRPQRHPNAQNARIGRAKGDAANAASAAKRYYVTIRLARARAQTRRRGAKLYWRPSAPPSRSGAIGRYGSNSPLSCRRCSRTLLPQQTQNLNLVAGHSVTWYPQDKEPRNYNLQTPSGEQFASVCRW